MKTLNWCFVVLGLLAPVAWLFGLLLWPTSLGDGHGYNQLMFLVTTSLSHLVIGALLMWAVPSGAVPISFSLSVLGAPIMHLIGSTTETPVCMIFFFGPAFVTLIIGPYFLTHRTV